ncbi:hypothetical protein CHS0354_007635 [Potamilus streckersoni]|uniref:Uncharacterized protein n=1 Tax=Potamilus streckersoni TaxID=2493646 RepID=A0AAE0SGW2_9BIVA|nr:hypothetical protein CHS0354_007635 [Potamilus streckersoni]
MLGNVRSNGQETQKAFCLKIKDGKIVLFFKGKKPKSIQMTEREELGMMHPFKNKPKQTTNSEKLGTFFMKMSGYFPMQSIWIASPKLETCSITMQICAYCNDSHKPKNPECPWAIREALTIEHIIIF